MLGGYAMSAITAITVQNTRGVSVVQALAPELVIAQIDACLSDIGADAIKIGMLGSAAIAALVAERLARLEGRVPIVFDPVMIASSGDTLADADTIASFVALIRLATLTTPNVAELAVLGGAKAMAAHGRAWLAKGGDRPGAVVTDGLMVPAKRRELMKPRVSLRGTPMVRDARCRARSRQNWGAASACPMRWSGGAVSCAKRWRRRPGLARAPGRWGMGR